MGNEIELSPLMEEHVDMIVEHRGGPAWHQDRSKWARNLAEHLSGIRYSLVALSASHPVGYCSLIFGSKYIPFAESNIPEISDLVVSEQRRDRGLGTGLIRAMEEEARKRKFAKIGIGVGLYADYGAAQHLYSKLGYILDGRGITAGPNCEPAKPGSMVRVDDDLVIWFTKHLAS